MSREFFDSIISGFYGEDIVPKGYSDDEIEVIEDLYAFRAVGMLRMMLSQMGRSAGGVLGDDASPLYSRAMGIRSHILRQWDFFRSMQDSDNHDYLDDPFVFSVLSETQYCFVRTTDLNHDIVYIFDSNSGSVLHTDQTLDFFLRDLVRDRLPYGVCDAEGDLLRVVVGEKWRENFPVIIVNSKKTY